MVKYNCSLPTFGLYDQLSIINGSSAQHNCLCFFDHSRFICNLGVEVLVGGGLVERLIELLRTWETIDEPFRLKVTDICVSILGNMCMLEITRKKVLRQKSLWKHLLTNEVNFYKWKYIYWISPFPHIDSFRRICSSLADDQLLKKNVTKGKELMQMHVDASREDRFWKQNLWGFLQQMTIEYIVDIGYFHKVFIDPLL